MTSTGEEIGSLLHARTGFETRRALRERHISRRFGSDSREERKEEDEEEANGKEGWNMDPEGG